MNVDTVSISQLCTAASSGNSSFESGCCCVPVKGQVQSTPYIDPRTRRKKKRETDMERGILRM